MSRNGSEEIEPIAGPSNAVPIVKNMNEYQLNDDDSDDDVDAQIHDNSLPIVENICEYAFDSDWESETDASESRSLAKKYFGKHATNPALMYMLEYTGLSQSQIMRLLKHHKDEKHKIVHEDARTFKDVCLGSMENESLTDDSPTHKFPENREKVSKSVELPNILPHVCEIRNNTSDELISFNSEPDNFVQVEPLKGDTETTEFISLNDANEVTTSQERFFTVVARSDNVMEIDTSDSGCDDFIEIQDVPIPEVGVLKTTMKQENIEITIKSEKPENDMFAEIFERSNEDDVMSNSYPEESIKINAEHRAVLIPQESNNSKNPSLAVVPQEPVVEETNIQSLENTKMNENVSCDVQNFVTPTDQNNTDLRTEKNFCNEERKAATLPTNKENLIKLKVYRYISLLFFL